MCRTVTEESISLVNIRDLYSEKIAGLTALTVLEAVRISAEKKPAMAYSTWWTLGVDLQGMERVKFLQA